MSQIEIQWSNPLLLHLKSVTRELMFDWVAISANLRNFAKEQNLNNDVAFITAATCREMFASDYSVEVIVPTAAEKSELLDTINSKDEGKTDKVNVNMEKMLKDYENMSLEDLIAHVEYTEENMKQRRENIFDRVLSSLGGDNLPSSIATQAVTSVDMELTRQAYNENLANKELERRKRQILEEEQVEKVRLELERESLRRRFEAGSADREGDDPLSSHAAERGITGMQSASKYGDSGGLYMGEKKSAELDFIDSLPYDPSVTQALESYMETDEFETMLTELEKEIEAMAPAKMEGEEPSELSEILKVLEVAAASNAAIASTKRPSPVHVPELAMQPTPDIAPVTAVAVSGRKSSSPSHRSTLGVPETEQVGTAADGASAAAGYPVSTAAPRLVSGATYSKREKEYQYARSRHPAPAARSGRSATELKAESSPENSEGEESAVGEGIGSSDSEEDWRAMRSRQKRAADKTLSRSAARSSTREDEQQDNRKVSAPGTMEIAGSKGVGGEGSGFWGAFGAPTVGEREPTLLPVLHQELPSDARINPRVEEFVASLPKDRFVEDESENEDEERIAAGQDVPEPASQALVEVADINSSIIPAASLGEEACPSPPSHCGVSEPQEVLRPPTPPTVPQSLEALSTVAVPSATVAPLAVPMSNAAPASGGLLGSTGAARRTKGKVGIIMGAARPRKSPLVASTGSIEAAYEVASAASEATTVNVQLQHAAVAAPTASVSVPVDTSATQVAVAAVAVPLIEEKDIPPAGPSEEELRGLQIKAAALLDTLSTPVLSPLPFAYISNKSSGSVVHFPTGTLPSRLTSVGCGVERIVLVDIDICALAESGSGDVAVGAVLAWLLSTIVGKYSLLALQWGVSLQEEPSEAKHAQICRVALETTSEAVTQAELIHLAQNTSLSSIVFPGCARGGNHTLDAPLSVFEVLYIRDSYSAPLLSELDFFCLPVRNEVVLQGVSADDAQPLLVGARDIAVCALKSHVLIQHSPERGDHRRSVLVDLLQECAKGGLRLCGMRLVHLNALELFEHEPFCSIPAYTRPAAPGEGATHSALKYDQHVLPVLCLAFYASSNGCNRPEATGACSVQGKSSTSVTNTAATVLRGVLGPEDPALARKTDPTSLRAVYGSSKESNLAYHIPHSADRLLRETTFWFGGRSSEGSLGGVETSASRSIAMLSVHSVRTVTMRCVLSSRRDALTAVSAGQLSAAQSTVLAGLVEVLGSSGELLSFRSASIPCLNTVAAVPAVVSTDSCEQVSEAPNTASAQCLVWRCRTHVGDAYLARSAETLQERVAACSGAVGWNAQFDFSCSALSEQPTLPSGSRLLALEMLKKVQEDDCKSHEDVGLADVAVLTIGTYGTTPQASAETVCTKDLRCNTAPAQMLSILLSVLRFLPKTCSASIIAVRSAERATGLAVGLRGYQILENIDYAVAEMQRAYSEATGSTSHTGSRTRTTGSRVVVEADIGTTAPPVMVKVLKGKKALEVLFSEFPLESLYLDLALRELYTYVPLPGLLRTGLPWHETVSAVAEAALQSGANTTSVDATLSFTPTQALQALYPPGVFTALGAVLVPWLQDAVTMTRNLAKVCARLEKDGFALLELKAVSAVSQSLLTSLYKENISEYTGVGQVGSAAAILEDGNVRQMLNEIASSSFVVILVRRRSALLKLKAAIGPVFSTELAEAQYPRSLACVLHSLSASTSSITSSRSATQKQAPERTASAPLLLPTLSCASAQTVLQEFFHHFSENYEAQQAAVSLNHTAQELHTTASDSALVEHLTECTEGSGVVAGQPLCIPQCARLNKSDGERVSAAELQLKTEKLANEAVSPSVLPGVLARHVDIAGVVVTRALLQEVGVGALLEALHREGLVVRNMYTTFLVPIAAKQLLQLAGASSLSMKPALSLLTGAPVLVLGLEGPAHAFVRFKSFPVIARSPAQLWKLGAHVQADPTGSTAGLSAEGAEWGVVASSSSRLAKDLYKHCFDVLHGADSAFTYHNTAGI